LNWVSKINSIKIFPINEETIIKELFGLYKSWQPPHKDFIKKAHVKNLFQKLAKMILSKNGKYSRIKTMNAANCISDGYSADEFCRFEAIKAQKLNKQIIVVICEDRSKLEQEKEWLLEMTIPNQPYAWFDNGHVNGEWFQFICEKICHIMKDQKTGIT
jgi:hypothetical protein